MLLVVLKLYLNPHLAALLLFQGLLQLLQQHSSCPCIARCCIIGACCCLRRCHSFILQLLLQGSNRSLCVSCVLCLMGHLLL